MESIGNDSQTTAPPRVPTTWQVYKSRFVPTQAFILIATLLLYFVAGMQAPTVVATFVFLQAAAMWGAFTGRRLLKRLHDEQRRREADDLPQAHRTPSRSSARGNRPNQM